MILRLEWCKNIFAAIKDWQYSNPVKNYLCASKKFEKHQLKESMVYKNIV